MDIALAVIVLREFAGLVTLGILLVVARRDLAGWARVERPALDSVTSDDRVVLVFSDIEGSTARDESMSDRD